MARRRFKVVDEMAPDRPDDAQVHQGLPIATLVQTIFRMDGSALAAIR
jgi:hypothetical protein